MKLQLSMKEMADKLNKVTDPNDSFLKECQADERKGVRDLLSRKQKAFEKEFAEKQKFHEMSQYERNLRESGFTYIAGIDEVGRGPLAGPVVAAAVILPESFYLPGLNDSKQISKNKLPFYYESISAKALDIGIGVVHAEEIDQINIYEATKKAMNISIANLSLNPDHLLIDAMKLSTPYPQLSLIKGDAISISISAASIIAKVTRDKMMKDYGLTYPQYGFEKNAGYGTSEHLHALKEFGPTPWHRRSFSPVREYIK